MLASRAPSPPRRQNSPRRSNAKFYTAEDASLPRPALLAMAKNDPRQLFATWQPLARQGTHLTSKQRREFMLLAKASGAWHGPDWQEDKPASQADAEEEELALALPGRPPSCRRQCFRN